MADTAFSSADFSAAEPTVSLRNDGPNKFSHGAVSIRGSDQASGREALVSTAAFSGSAEVAAIYLPACITRGISPIGGKTKRVLDIFIAGAALVALAPFFILVAAAVKLNMGGPVLYRHRRIGFNGIPFDCLKFRTMVAHSDAAFRKFLESNPAAADEWRQKRKLENDPRVTRLGHLLRKSSLDELPQLINVLRGDMSLVGPRPVVAQELELYGNFVGDYFRARPGVTGLWQISGRSSLSFDQRVALDSAYVRKWTLAKDVTILLQTVPAIFNTPHAI